jgi:hypothetical protein
MAVILRRAHDQEKLRLSVHKVRTESSSRRRRLAMAFTGASASPAAGLRVS